MPLSGSRSWTWVLIKVQRGERHALERRQVLDLAQL